MLLDLIFFQTNCEIIFNNFSLAEHCNLFSNMGCFNYILVVKCTYVSSGEKHLIVYAFVRNILYVKFKHTII